ncbi:class I SAM-dependent methyltransferase [Ornithinimicrobium sp. F0845]|uniref:class I SAM-dependent methyltransferase n=1 Tax=Ornithinimicrobium sp. F0845 TaxID=2926412 RepID=UPI001FF207A3|nr:class I SAM-dependent methyltransferase [Ornithinimicrobium sp. F0845]MCK0112200.1 class I SAM-dependent methyltransferase [Ornithinimicrobium sp. F0845]
MPSHEDVVSWYEHSDDEAARLAGNPHSRLEGMRTRELISRHLPQGPLDVLDVGGAAGAYAGWLAGLGHRVHLVDPVPRHVAGASRVAGVTAAVGDARSLVEADGSQDAVLLLGPLYHLPDPADRHTALAEARRVTRPGGRIFAAAISRYNVIGEFALNGQLTERYQEIFAHLVRTGENSDTVGFPLGHAHTADELAREATAAGWTEVEAFGVEGPMGYAFDLVAPDRIEEVLPQAHAAARLLEKDPRAMDLCPHLLVTAVNR